MNIDKRSFCIALLLVCGVLLFVPLEGNIGSQLTRMLSVTLSVYAVLRGLNAVISTAQGTELSIEPMGVGMTLTPGEILDPLNDLIEQVSTVLLFASASIGIQKIILNLTDIALLRWALVMFVVCVIALVASQKLSYKHQQSMIRIVLFLTVLRLVVPVMVLSSGAMQSWLEAEREQSVATLVTAENNIQKLNQSNATQEKTGWFESITSKFQLSNLFSSIEIKAEQAVTASISLLAQFVFVFILIPILFMWLAYRLIAWQFLR